MQRTKRFFFSLVLLLVPSSALAGDPCPIGFLVFDVGPPPWLAAKKNEYTVNKPNIDPFLDALIEHAGALDCSRVRRGKLKDGHLPIKPNDTTKDKLAKSYLLKQLFEKNRRFRCRDAAKRLRSIRYAGSASNVLYIRGRRRILLTIPGWDTVCIRAKTVDGPNLTKKNVLRVWKKLTRRLVAFRHANP
jgi:hypothetical protein